jgi:hypothetical protein
MTPATTHYAVPIFCSHRLNDSQKLLLANQDEKNLPLIKDMFINMHNIVNSCSIEAFSVILVEKSRSPHISLLTGNWPAVMIHPLFQ